MPDNLRPEASAAADAEARHVPPDGSDEAVPTEVEAYLRAADPPDDDEMAHQSAEVGLARLKRAMALRSAWQGEDWNERIDTPYAFQAVRSWLAVISVAEGGETADRHSRLVGGDVDQLAEDIASRAENGLRETLGRIHWWLGGEPPDLKLLHLAECLRQLPGGYRNWQLRHHHTVTEDEIEGLAFTGDGTGDSAWPMRQLYACLTTRRERTVHVLMQTLRFSEPEAVDIVDASLGAFNVVLRGA